MHLRGTHQSFQQLLKARKSDKSYGHGRESGELVALLLQDDSHRKSEEGISDEVRGITELRHEV